MNNDGAGKTNLSLTLMNIESDILCQLSIDEIMDSFGGQKARRVNMTK